MIRNSDCRDCPLWEGANTVCVAGEGRDLNQRPWDAYPRQQYDVMVVGEQPGAQEDLEGHPFLGKSGIKLHAALAQIGISEFFVTNVTRCFNGYKASTGNISACKHYLWEEIEHVRPRFILALGSVAWHQFGTGPITEVAGREIWREDLGFWVLPTVHPAFVLRDPNRERAWLADLARFGNLVHGKLVSKPPVTVKIATTKEDLIELTHELTHCEAFSYDFECRPIPWWHQDFLAYTLAFSTAPDSATVVPIDHPDVPRIPERQRTMLRRWFTEVLPRVMAEKGIQKAAHNRLYDDLVFYRITGVLPVTQVDTMVQAHILDENRPKALKWLGRALLGWPNWDVDAKRDHPLDVLAQYNGTDTAATLRLRERFLSDLAESPRLEAYYRTLEAPKLQSLARMVARGIHVSRPKLVERRAQNLVLREEAAAKIPVENPASIAQIRKWLFDDLKLDPVMMTAGGTVPSTNEETIKTLSQRHPEVRVILPWRKHQRYETTYFKPIQTALDNSYDGRYHYEGIGGRNESGIRSTGTETGRLSSSFHTIPRDPFVRGVFGAPAGFVLVEADYAQIEARLAAWTAAGRPRGRGDVESTDGRMLQAWLEERDVYREQAAACLNISVHQVTKDQRQALGKVVVLALLYRMQPKGLREYAWREYELDWSLREATKYYAAFHRLWPEFQQWHQKTEKLIRFKGYIETEIGRRRRLPAAMESDDYSAYEAVNSGINSPIQGLASDLTQTAMIVWDQTENTDCRIVGNIHDALLFEVPQDKMLTVLPKIRMVMEQSWKVLKPLGLNLPEGLIKAELKVGPWGESHEVEDLLPH